MTDFLQNLIARHLDAEPHIKPRLPSIFESEVCDGGMDLKVPVNKAPDITEKKVDGDTNPDPEETISSPAAGLKLNVPSPRELSDSSFISPVSKDEQQTAALIAEGNRQTSAPEKMLDEGLNHSGPGQDYPIRQNLHATTLPNERENGPTDRLSPKNISSKEQIKTEAPARRQKRGANVDPDPQKKPAREIFGEEFSADSLFSLSKTAGVSELNSRPGLNNPFATRDEAGRAQGLLKPSALVNAPVIPAGADAERPDSRQEPIINVTIGRVEVRATVSPERKRPKAENRPATMGLEDYLRRRSGGSDR